MPSRERSEASSVWHLTFLNATRAISRCRNTLSFSLDVKCDIPYTKCRMPCQADFAATRRSRGIVPRRWRNFFLRSAPRGTKMHFLGRTTDAEARRLDSNLGGSFILSRRQTGAEGANSSASAPGYAFRRKSVDRRGFCVHGSGRSIPYFTRWRVGS